MINDGMEIYWKIYIKIVNYVSFLLSFRGKFGEIWYLRRSGSLLRGWRNYINWLKEWLALNKCNNMQIYEFLSLFLYLVFVFIFSYSICIIILPISNIRFKHNIISKIENDSKSLLIAQKHRSETKINNNFIL